MNNYNNSQLFLKVVSSSKFNDIKKFINDYSKIYDISNSNIDFLYQIFDIIIKSNEVFRLEMLIKYSNLNLKNYVEYIFPNSINSDKILKWLYLNKFYNKISIEEAFYKSCYENEIKIAKWLSSIEPNIDFHKNNDELFRICCENNFNEIIILLCQLDKFKLKIESFFNDQYEYEEPFHFFCRYNYLELAKLYINHFDFDIHTLNDEAICLSCQEGNLEMAKYCYQLGADLEINNNWCMVMAVIKKNIKIVLWIFTLNIIDFHFNDEYLFKLSCLENCLILAKFIYSLDNFDKGKIDDDFFFNLCIGSSLEVMDWFHQEFNFNLNYNDDMIFRYVSQQGEFEKLKWIYEKSDVDIHVDKEFVFRIVCSLNYIDIAKWLHSLGNVKIKSCNNEAFVTACHNNNLEIALWLSEINPNEYKIQVEDNKITYFQILKLIMVHGVRLASNNPDCCICYEKPDVVTHCNHTFCKDCYLKYVNSKEMEYEEVPCPYCREKDLKIYELVLN